jgi:hypothetical protein
MDSGRLGASEESADVLRILERIEDEHEWRLAALDRPREHVVDPGVDPRLDRERDPLVAIEPGERGQGATLDLDDRDPQAGRVKDEPLECLTPLRDDEQAMGRPARDERLFDRPPPGDELLVVGQQVRRRDRRAE